MKKSSKVFTLSDESKNLYEFTVLTAGIDRTDFDKNPVCLYNHDYDQLLGLWSDLSISNTILLGTPSFDEEDPNAMLYCSKAEQGILRGASIGIVPIEYDSVNQIMRRCSLKEVSLTPVPANRNAIAIYNAKGQKLNGKEAKQYLLSLQPENTLTTENPKKMNENLIKALVALCLQAGHTITLSAQSTDGEIEGAIKKAGDKLTELTGKVLILETQAKTAAEKEIDELVDTAITEKRLSASDRQAFVDFGKANLTALKSTLTALKAPEVKTIPGAATTTTTTTAGAEDKSTWTYDDFALKAPAELETMMGSDPTRFNTLLSAKSALVRQMTAIGSN